ncbi:hypothetical protein AAES_108124 [Amazona aestiva]|uniref:Uncharacterized protein n=1 Tax=Amazona aestiva TaxID=12930 RepID=A0A0Q3TFC2_AMAAE|nr:hypothetical protein AAES_108124 [Amazona aestiva]
MEKVLELARPQLALVPLGYSMTLLLWDPRGPGPQLPCQSIVWQVISTIFQELEALGRDARSLQTVSLVQVCSHDKAWDLLHPNGRALQMMDVAPLGLEEVLAALGLAERVKGLARRISATLWDPAQEITARRRLIRGLRLELLAAAAVPEQEVALAQLRKALRELRH